MLLKKWCDSLYYSDCSTQIAAVWPLGLVSFLIVFVVHILVMGLEPVSE